MATNLLKTDIRNFKLQKVGFRNVYNSTIITFQIADTNSKLFLVVFDLFLHFFRLHEFSKHYTFTHQNKDTKTLLFHILYCTLQLLGIGYFSLANAVLHE